MKSVFKWGRKAGLAGGILLSSLVFSAAQVWALTTEQVVERLRSVPVFTLANAEGAPLLAVPQEGEQRNPIASIFINQQDAQAFLDNLKSREPQTAEGIQVVPIPLAKVYEYEVNQNQAAEEQLRFAFIPDRQQVAAAQTLLQQSGQNVENFEGVPLFVAKSGSGTDNGYLTISQGDQQVIPMFFEQAELQALLNRLKEVQPELASNVQVQVVNLEGVIDTLRTSDNQELNRIVLIPPQSSRDFLRSLQPQGGQGAGGNRPAQQNNAQPQR